MASKNNAKTIDKREAEGDIELKVPVLPDSVSDGELIVWNKGEGDAVQRDEVLAEIETDKVVLEVPAPADGVLEQIRIKAGSSVSSNETIAVIRPKRGNGPTSKPAPAADRKPALSTADSAPPVPMKPGIPALSPAVRRLVEQHELDPNGITGTGKGGRITKEDVLRHLSDLSNSLRSDLESVFSGPEPKLSPRPGIEPRLTDQPESGHASRSSDEDIRDATAGPDNTAGYSIEHEDSGDTDEGQGAGDGDGRPLSPGHQFHSGSERVETRQSMSRLRARIAERLVEAQHTAAILTTFNEVNLQPVMDLRARYQADFQKRHGVKLGLMPFFVKACAEALELFPVINASVEGKDIVYHEFFDIGIAVGSPRGLVVPVLRDCDQLGFADIEAAIRDFAQRAEDNSLTMDDLTGGTFTISNGGVYGSMLSTPILNPPQSAILGMHKIQQRPIVEAGEIVARPMMYLALSYDHRIIDGKEAVQFLVAVKESLEDPTRLLLQV